MTKEYVEKVEGMKKMRPERLELPTLGSEDRCSVQLSYGRLPYFRLIAATGTRAERPLRLVNTLRG